MNPRDGLFRQRVGALIETEVCDKFGLFYNKRQTVFGYYDAYKDDDLFEIKASSINSHTFVIRLRNHKRLLNSKGFYIFVSYSLVDKDRDLKVISDILIENIYIVSAFNIDKIFKKFGTKSNKKIEKNKQYFKLQLNAILKTQDIKTKV